MLLHQKWVQVEQDKPKEQTCFKHELFQFCILGLKLTANTRKCDRSKIVRPPPPPDLNPTALMIKMASERGPRNLDPHFFH